MRVRGLGGLFFTVRRFRVPRVFFHALRQFRFRKETRHLFGGVIPDQIRRYFPLGRFGGQIALIQRGGLPADILVYQPVVKENRQHRHAGGIAFSNDNAGFLVEIPERDDFSLYHAGFGCHHTELAALESGQSVIFLRAGFLFLLFRKGVR